MGISSLTKSLLVLGSGGHASVLVDILLFQGREILAVFSPVTPRSAVFNGIQHYVSDDDILKFDKDQVLLVNGIGSLPKDSNLRKTVYEKFTSLGYSFASVVADSAVVSKFATLQSGSQVLHTAVVQADSTIAQNTIVNTGATIDHGCVVGSHCHIAPGATLSGGVCLGDMSHVGTGASIIQGIQIEKNVTIGAGATVLNNIDRNALVLGHKAIVIKDGK